MDAFNYIDTKFLAINGDLSNTISGGTAILRSVFVKDTSQYVIKAHLPTVNLKLLSIELLDDKIIISSSVETITNNGVVFNMSFASKAFKIPPIVNQEKIEARTKNGELIIELPISNIRNSRDHNNIDINFDDDF